MQKPTNLDAPPNSLGISAAKSVMGGRTI